MSRSMYSILALILLPNLVSATIFADTCGKACANAIASSASFDDCNSILADEAYYGCACSSPLFAANFALCLSEYCSKPAHLYQYELRGFCDGVSIASIGGLEYKSALDLAQPPLLSYAGLNYSVPVNGTFVIPEDVMVIWKRTIHEYYFQLDYGEITG